MLQILVDNNVFSFIRQQRYIKRCNVVYKFFQRMMFLRCKRLHYVYIKEAVLLSYAYRARPSSSVYSGSFNLFFHDIPCAVDIIEIAAVCACRQGDIVCSCTEGVVGVADGIAC